MDNNVGNDRVLETMNNDISLDLYRLNAHLEDFRDLNDCLDCKYFTEDSFSKKYAQSNDLIFLNVNVQSLASKFISLISFLDNLNRSEIKPDIFSVQEIWKLQKEFYDIPNYNFYCTTRKKGQGGGVGIYVKNSFNTSLLKEESIFIEHVFESIVLKVEIPSVKKFICISLYRPPTNNKNMSAAEQFTAFFQHLSEMLQKLDKHKLPVYILTDSNIDLMKFGSNNNATDFFQTLLEFGYFQLIGKTTRIANESKSLIDHIFTNDSIVNINSGVIIDTFSDHFITFCNLKSSKSKQKKSPKHIFRRNFDHNNMDVFKNYLSNLTWNNVLSSSCPEESYNIFWEDFYHLFELSFPIKKIKLNRNNHPINKFMSKGLLKSRKTKLRLARKSNQSAENRTIYVNYRNLYNSLIKTAKAIYYREKIQSANGDSKKIWETINEACNKKSKSSIIDKLDIDGHITNDESKIANAFNKHFATVGEKVSDFIPKSNVNFRDYLPPPCNNSIFLHPVSPGELVEIIMNMGKKHSLDVNDIPFKVIQYVATDIMNPLSHTINLSIEKGIFPSKLKTSKIIPIFKKGSLLSANDHRGVALVNNISKIYEKCFCRRLLKFLHSNNFFDENQFGFLKDRSTNHAILKIINFVSDSINRNEYVVGIFLDAMKAFDSVNHAILFSKLENAGIRGNALNLFKSYLTGRNQKVKIGETWSELEDINISVLQGSILGVILFIIFINDLQYASLIALAVIFADDNSSLFAHKDINELNRIVNEELEKICNWYKANKLALHPDKSKFILFKSPYDNLDQLPKVDNQPYFPVSINMNDYNESDNAKIKMIQNIPNSNDTSLRVLGVLFDQNLSLSDHVKSIHSKLSRSLYSLRQVSNIFSTPILKLIYHANFHSHINYCSNILSICNKTTLDPLIKIQKKAIRIVCKVPYNTHSNPLFKEHNILPISQQIEYSSLMFMHDYLHERLSPSFQFTWVKNNQLHDNYQLRNGNNIHIKPHRYEYLKRHPIINFASLWNNLGNDVKDIDNRNKFSSKIKNNMLESLL